MTTVDTIQHSMQLAEENGKSSIRLDPFALPSETNERFVLLIVAAIALVLGIGTTISIPMTIVSGGVIEDYADVVFRPASLSEVEYQEGISNFLEVLRTHSPYFIASYFLPLVLLSVIFLAAFIIYRRHSDNLQRRRGFVLLTREKDAKLVDAIEEIKLQTGISTLKTVFLDPTSSNADAQVFGFRNNYHLRLGKGMRLLLRKQPEMFRTIVLHELAHITNGDVFRTYFAQALWKAVVYCGIPILIAIFAMAGSIWMQHMQAPSRPTIENLESIPLPFTFAGGVLLAAILLPFWMILFAIVAQARASILRTRELFADSRAAVWGGYQQLTKIFGQLPPRIDPLWKRPWRLHPGTNERLGALEHPRILFDMSRLTFFVAGLLSPYLLVGLLLAILSSHYAFLVLGDIGEAFAAIQKSQGVQSLNLFAMIASMNLSLLLTGLLSMGMLLFLYGSLAREVQRKALADLSSDIEGIEPYRCLGIYSLIYMGGLFTSALSIFIFSPLYRFTLSASFPILWMSLVLTLFVWLFLSYIYRNVRLVFSDWEGPVAPRIATRHLIFTGAVMLASMSLATAVGPMVNLFRWASFALQHVPELEIVGHEADQILSANPTLSMTDLASQLPQLQQLLSDARQQSISGWSMFTISVIAVLLVCVLFFAITYWLYGNPRVLGRIRCVYCGHPHSVNILVRPFCIQCRRMMPSWAFLKASRTGTPEPENLAEDELVHAYAARDMGRYGKTKEACQSALEIDPDDAEAYNLLGIAHESLNEVQPAQSAYKKALDLEPQFQAARQNLRELDVRVSEKQADEPRTSSGWFQRREFKLSDFIWFVIVSLIGRFLFADFADIMSPISGAIIALFLAFGLAWLVDRLILSRVTVERTRVMSLSVALQSSHLIMIALIDLLVPDLISYPFIIYVLYVAIIVWHVLDPGLGPTFMTVLIQIGLILPFSFIQMFVDLMPLSVPLVAGVIIYVTFAEYKQLREFDRDRLLSHRADFTLYGYRRQY